MWEIYDAVLDTLPRSPDITYSDFSDCWTLAETETASGLAMTTPFDQRPAIYPSGINGMRAVVAAQAVKSWNLREAGFGMAAANACCNTPERLAALGCAEPFSNYCTRGLSLDGLTVGVVGHLKMPEEITADAKAVYILERAPGRGDYPDSACDFLLPECEVVLITGSALVNKTLPHLLELCRDAVTILTGPTVPMCPALLECGIDRLAGLVVTDRAGIRARVRSGADGSPYSCGEPFLLMKD